ncbi:MAG: hypothetical protein JO000_02915 [Alphaproteobacteria bacterium]|nr:hypothetical protein [Alphaproteobacteria bacterium]
MILRISLAALLAAFTLGLALAQGPSAPKPAQPAPQPNGPQAGQTRPPPASSNSHAVRVGPDAIDGNKPVIVKRNAD